MSIAAWIISLNPDTDAVQSLLASLQQEGIDARIFPAVDGRHQMPALLPGETLSQTRALIYRKAPLTRSEVGCYLSHLRAIRNAYEQGLSHACIFEDDVVIEPGLGALLHALVALDADAHLVRLMELKIRKRKIVQPLGAGFTLTRPQRGALGAQGYVLNRTGMKKIIDASHPLYMPFDKLLDSFFLFDLHCFSVEPHAIYERLHPSSIIKTRGILDRRPWVVVAWHLNKLYRSLRRRLHYLAHRSEFDPAEKPVQVQGKSERIR